MSLRKEASASASGGAPASSASFRGGIPGAGSAAYMEALRRQERGDFRREQGVDLKVAAAVPRNLAGVPLDEAAESPPPYLLATVGDAGAVGYAGINSSRHLHFFQAKRVLCVQAPKVGAKCPPRLRGAVLINSETPTLASFWVDVAAIEHFEIGGGVQTATKM